MTPERRRDFEAEWPELAGRLKRMLARRGVPEARRDDVVQETAVRLYGCWETVDRSRPAWPLTRTIALNHMRDQARRRIKEVATDVPEVAHEHSVENAGLARLELGQVRAAMDELTPEARASLLVEVGSGRAWNTRASAAEKMQRMRARRKLRTMLNRVPAALSLRLARVTDLGEWLLGTRGGAAGGIPCIACAAIGLTALVPGTIGAGVLTEDGSVPRPTQVERAFGAPRGPAASGAIVGLSVTEADAIRAAASNSSSMGGVSKGKKKSSSSNAEGGGLVPPPPQLPTAGSTPESGEALATDPGDPLGGGGGGETPGLPPAPNPGESTPLQTINETLKDLESLL